MASLHSIPRFLLPRGGQLLLRPRAFPVPIMPLIAMRYASNSPLPPRTLRDQLKDRGVIPKDAPRVIPQPDKYRPPSHGRRNPRSETLQKSYGAPLTLKEKEEMRRKKYPNMMAAEDTIIHWFLHNQTIHVFISMSILFSLAIAAFYIDFQNKCIYKEFLPSRKDWFRHPIASFNQFVDIYKQHSEHISQVAQSQQLKKYEDIEKRKQFRLDRIRECEERGEEYVDPDPRYYVDEMGVRRRKVRRWFGIWE